MPIAGLVVALLIDVSPAKASARATGEPHPARPRRPPADRRLRSGLPAAPALAPRTRLRAPSFSARALPGPAQDAPGVVGADTGRFLFDTGGGASLVTPQLARSLGCSPAGRSVGFRMSGRAGGVRLLSRRHPGLRRPVIPHEPVGVFDLMALLPEACPAARRDRLPALLRGAHRHPGPGVRAAGGGDRRLGGGAHPGLSPLRARFATGPGGGELVALPGDRAPGPCPSGSSWTAGTWTPCCSRRTPPPARRGRLSRDRRHRPPAPAGGRDAPRHRTGAGGGAHPRWSARRGLDGNGRLHPRSASPRDVGSPARRPLHRRRGVRLAAGAGTPPHPARV